MANVIIVGALPESLVNFRGEFIRSLVLAGHSITAMAGEADRKSVGAIEALGVKFRPFPIARAGLNPLNEIRTLYALRQTFLEIKPDIVIAYTIKPVIWSGVALFRLREVSFFALITGLGFSFDGTTVPRRILRTIASALYRLSLRRATGVVFQNKDNRDFAIQNNLAPSEKCFVVDGSGVDISWFKPTELPSGPPVFLLIARLLADKGLREYAIAAALVKSRYTEAVFQLLGPTDSSPNAIPIDEVNSWNKNGSIHYLGSAEDVRPFISKCHVYVLPSYHEGMPRTVLEAMSMGRPILTTDTPGCRETVVPDLNGHIIPKANAEALANKLIWFLENRSRWQDMGASSRQIAETRFDVHKINRELINIFNLDCIAFNGQDRGSI